MLAVEWDFSYIYICMLVEIKLFSLAILVKETYVSIPMPFMREVLTECTCFFSYTKSQRGACFAS